MSDNLPYQAAEQFLRSYECPKCIPVKSYDDQYFHNELINPNESNHSKDETELLCKCGVPRFCHPSAPHFLCKLSQEFINENKGEYITINHLCIPCLRDYNICSPVSAHPPKYAQDFTNVNKSFLEDLFQNSPKEDSVNKSLSDFNQYPNTNVFTVVITYWDRLEGYNILFRFPSTIEGYQIFFHEFMQETARIFSHLLESSDFKLYYVLSNSKSHIVSRRIISNPIVLISILKQIVSTPVDLNRPYLLYICKVEEKMQNSLVSTYSSPNSEPASRISTSLNSIISECKKRYKHTCLFCEFESEFVEVTHILEVEEYYTTKNEDRDELLAENGLTLINSPNNFICLCTECNIKFSLDKTLGMRYLYDQYILCVKETVFNTIIIHGKYKGQKYQDLNNKILNVEFILPIFRPQIEAINYRYKKFLL